MPTSAAFLVLLVPTGAAVLTTTPAATPVHRLGSTDAMPGRVTARHVLVFLRGNPLGAVLARSRGTPRAAPVPAVGAG